jgi:cytochrome c-type biogenesis protein
MSAFGLGAPRLDANLPRQLMTQRRERLLTAGEAGKTLMGAAALAVPPLIAPGVDRTGEAAWVNALPVWLIDAAAGF